MLNEVEKHLIASAVDGELSTTEETHFRTLLAESTEAVRLYQALLQDHTRLKALPFTVAPPTLLPQVLSKIAPDRQPKVGRKRAGEGTWLPYAIVASLLVSVTAGSYIYFSQPTGGNGVAKQDLLPGVDAQPSHNIVAQVQPQPATIPSVTLDNTPKNVFVQAPVAVERAPLPRVKTIPVFGAATTELPPLVTYDAKLPVIFSMAELSDPEVTKKLKGQFANTPAVRVDLFTKDPHRASDLAITAFRSGTTSLLVDLATQERIKAKLPLAWAIYTESLTADEAIALCTRMATADLKNPNASVLTSGHITHVSLADTKETFSTFGIDSGNGKKAKPGNVSVADATADKVAASVSKGPTGSAIMTTFLPTKLRLTPSQSREIKQYHDRKGERKENAVPLLIVIRPAV